MTLSRFPLVTTWAVVLLLPGLFFVQLVAMNRPEVPLPLRVGVPALVAIIALLPMGFVLAGPRAVKLEPHDLVVERLFWPAFRVSLAEVEAAEAGPPIGVMGAVRRVAGNGGLMGFTGLYHVRDVGLVRCFATRLGAPTVVVRRKEGRPLLLGVDDGAALLEVLTQRLARRSI